MPKREKKVFILKLIHRTNSYDKNLEGTNLKETCNAIYPFQEYTDCYMRYYLLFGIGCQTGKVVAIILKIQEVLLKE